MEEDLIKQADIEKIAQEGDKIYQEIKSKYEPHENGKYLAIEIESKDVYMAEDSVEAMQLARKAHPGKIFYLVRIGFDSVETLANSFL